MSDLFELPWQREKRILDNAGQRYLVINGYTIQNMTFELLSNFMLRNTPESVGIPLPWKFDKDELKSEILLEIANTYNPASANKRPAIFIRRNAVSIKSPTLDRRVGLNAQESESKELLINSTQIEVKVVAKPFMAAELLAEYVKIPLLYFRSQVQQDFYLRRYALNTISAVDKFVDATDYFAIILSIDVAFDDGYIIKGDDLKLKTVSKYIFDSLTEPPIQVER